MFLLQLEVASIHFLNLLFIPLILIWQRFHLIHELLLSSLHLLEILREQISPIWIRDLQIILNPKLKLLINRRKINLFFRYPILIHHISIIHISLILHMIVVLVHEIIAILELRLLVELLRLHVLLLSGEHWLLWVELGMVLRGLGRDLGRGVLRRRYLGFGWGDLGIGRGLVCLELLGGRADCLC